MPPRWIWQQPDWPALTWQPDALAPLLRRVTQTQGRLIGRDEVSSSSDTDSESSLDILLQNIIASSAIEGENLNAESVRSSLARRLGLPQVAHTRGNALS